MNKSPCLSEICSLVSTIPHLRSLRIPMHQGSTLYPFLIHVMSLGLLCIVKITAICTSGRLSSIESGRHDRASATMFCSLFMYVIVYSYCNRYSIQWAWHCDRSRWKSKFCRVLWSIQIWMCVPRRSTLHFFSACMIDNISGSWMG